MRYSMALAVLFLGFASSRGTADEGVRPLPFRLHDRGDIVVPVTIDGEGPFEFLLDTGSSRTAVSEETARRLRLVAVAQTLLVTPLGQVTRPLTPLERVKIGTGPPATALATILPWGALPESGIDGIIGQDILARRPYTIDYQRRHLAWHPAAIPERTGVRLPIEFSEDRLFVLLPQAEAGVRAGRPAKARTLRLIPDSGADCLVFFVRPGRMLPPMTELDTALLTTVSGGRVVTAVLIAELEIGGIRFRHQPAVRVDRRQIDPRLGDGLMPLNLFARATFNIKDRYLIVESR